jgi:hypothetical protein
MSTGERVRTKIVLPPLVAGQHLDQPTFHERYEAMPPETRAELVGGVVYMPSPMRLDHGNMPGRDGIYRSEVFPGLWLEAEALFAEDLDRLMRVLDEGLATPEHAAFAAKLIAAGAGRKSQ